MKIAVAGGDLRMLTVADLLKSAGYECEKTALGDKNGFSSEVLKNADAVILPLPCFKDGYLFAPTSDAHIGVSEVLDACGEDTLVLGGGLPFCDSRHIDYATDESFLLKNAFVTAEGAISIAMSELKAALCYSKATVLGYGRIGKCLAKMLCGLGCEVTVIARREPSRTEAEFSGHRAVDFDSSVGFDDADVIFNTVPFAVMGKREICFTKKDALLIDLASGNGGIDKNAAHASGRKLIHALALPGKYSPVTAGRIIYETIVSFLSKEGVRI